MKTRTLMTLALLILVAGCGGGKEKGPQAAVDQLNALSEAKIADALAAGCEASTSDLVAFMKAFLPKVGIDPSLATNPDVQEAVDNLKGVHTSSLPESCGVPSENVDTPIDEPEADEGADENPMPDPDVTPPHVVNIRTLSLPIGGSGYAVEITFSEEVDLDSIVENKSIEIIQDSLFGEASLPGRFTWDIESGFVHFDIDRPRILSKTIYFHLDRPLTTARNRDGSFTRGIGFYVRIHGTLPDESGIISKFDVPEFAKIDPSRAVKDFAGNPMTASVVQELRCTDGPTSGLEIHCRVIGE